MTEPTPLFDWIVNANCVRGSRANDQGVWLSTSACPLSFSPLDRRLVLADKSQYLLRKETSCRALGLDRRSELVLAALPSQ